MQDEFKGYELLVEKEAMWAEMLEQVLKDNGVDYVSVPVYGAGMVLRGGVMEHYRIYVPKEKLTEAEELQNELFSGSELPVAPEDEEEPEEE